VVSEVSKASRSRLHEPPLHQEQISNALLTPEAKNGILRALFVKRAVQVVLL